MDFTLYENRNTPNSGSISQRPIGSALNKTSSLPHFLTKNQNQLSNLLQMKQLESHFEIKNNKKNSKKISLKLDKENVIMENRQLKDINCKLTNENKVLKTQLANEKKKNQKMEGLFQNMQKSNYNSESDFLVQKLRKKITDLNTQVNNLSEELIQIKKSKQHFDQTNLEIEIQYHQNENIRIRNMLKNSLLEQTQEVKKKVHIEQLYSKIKEQEYIIKQMENNQTQLQEQIDQLMFSQNHKTNSSKSSPVKSRLINLKKLTDIKNDKKITIQSQNKMFEDDEYDEYIKGDISTEY